MVQIIERKILKDERGWFLKTLTGKEEGLPPFTGEIYTVCGYPNKDRGGHYHKVAKEWFTLLVGQALLRLEDIKSQEELSILLSADQPVTIVVPPFIAHRFENNSGNDFLLLAYTDVHYDPLDTIHYHF